MQLRQESGLFRQVSQLELHGTHLPEIDTSLLSGEQEPVHYPKFSSKLMPLGQEVQKSGLLSQVPHLGSQGLHCFN